MKKYINQSDMKQANDADVFLLVRRHGMLTRKEIESRTGFSWGAVSSIVSRLMEQRYIKEVKCEQSGGAGRIPTALTVDTEAHFVLGMDINLSGFKAVVLNLAGSVTDSIFYRPKADEKDGFFEEILNFSRRAVSLAEGKHLLGVGIAMQGTVDAEKGISHTLPHVKGWHDVPLAQMLAKELTLPVFIAHDPDCILHAASEGTGVDTTMLLRVDRGIGMALMVDGEILEGKGMLELGHVIAVPDGLPCRCGKRGCLESYASISGLERRSGLSLDALACRARQGDEEAAALFSEMGRHLALAVSHVAQLFCVKELLLCGAIWDHRALFYPLFEECLKKCYDQKMRVTQISVENAAKGAAMLALEKALTRMNEENK